MCAVTLKPWFVIGLFILASVSLASGAGESMLLASSPVTVGANVPASSRTPVEQFDHGSWDALLRKYVDKDGMVQYAAWKSSTADVQLLDAYLTRLSAASFGRSTRREVKLAFWINAYNAVTVKGILREYPTTSIRNHTAALFGYNMWKDLRLPVDGQSYSQDAIEHQVLRKMSEPRIHFAIVCASIGCPRLLNQAYHPDRLEEQLTANARHFFADSTKLSVDSGRGTIRVSPILKWFGEDFGVDDAARLRLIAPYAPDPIRSFVARGSARIEFLDYDWGLNDAGTRANRQ
jgi:hypothetical protein